MRMAFAALVIASLCMASNDPRDCRYWLLRLDDIGRLESSLIYDAPMVHVRDGDWAAAEFKYEVKNQLRRVMRQIEAENGK